MRRERSNNVSVNILRLHFGLPAYRAPAAQRLTDTSNGNSGAPFMVPPPEDQPLMLRRGARIESDSRPMHRDTLTDYRQGPVSQEDTQTDFNEMNVLNNTVAPSTSIDACLDDGFQLNNGLKITGGSGVLLMGGEAFSWRPWTSKKGRLINGKGQWECGKDAWGILDLVWPKPGTSTVPERFHGFTLTFALRSSKIY